ncbi:MAG: HAD family phosphatase [Chloroflexi bacterium]|jgi:beta-phosphoglucomutase|nr:HAD family phosphatase [Chloroflexota bacterium]
MNKLEGILWDMDGVLVDTGEFHFHSWQTALDAHNIPFSRQAFRETFGMNNTGILKLLLGERFIPTLYEEISTQKEISFRQAIQGKVALLPGVSGLLDAVQKAEIPQAIASSAPPENIHAIISELGLGDFFQAQISAFAMPGKPDPAVFLAAAQALKATPSACVVIEDAIAGVQAAQRAGMKCIAVTTTNSASVLSFADRVVANLVELTVKDLELL